MGKSKADEAAPPCTVDEVFSAKLSEDGALLTMRLGSKALRGMEAEARKSLEGDLGVVSERCGGSAELLCPADAATDIIVLRGDPELLEGCKEELVEMLKFYGVAPNACLI